MCKGNSWQSKYAFAHLKWHNLKSIHPTIVKLSIFIKLLLQGFQKWHYFYDRGKSENMIADQNVKFDKNLFLISGNFSSWSLCEAWVWTPTIHV